MYDEETIIEANLEKRRMVDKLEAAKKRVEEERLIGMSWFDDFTALGAQMEDSKKRVKELVESNMVLTLRLQELEDWLSNALNKST